MTSAPESVPPSQRVNALLHTLLPPRTLLTEEEMFSRMALSFLLHGFKTSSSFSAPFPFEARLAKDGWGWEFSQPAVDEVADYLADAAWVPELQAYLESKGVKVQLRTLERVPVVEQGLFGWECRYMNQTASMSVTGGTPQFLLVVAILLDYYPFIEHANTMIGALCRELGLTLRLEWQTPSSQEAQEAAS